MVARADEESRLSSALQKARAGEPQVVVVEGELGSGKTWLIEQLISRAADARVLEHTAFDASEAVPFSAVDDLLAQAGGRRRAGDGGDPAAVATLLVARIAALSAEAPVIVALDDAHDLDDASADVIWRAVRRMRHGRVLVLVATRAHGHLRGLLTRGSSAARNRVLLLGGMPPAGVAQLAAEHGLPDLRAAHLDTLTELTDGNPLHVITAVTRLGARLRDSVPRYLPVPPDFADDLERRLADVSPPARALLDIVAVVGEPASLPVLLTIAQSRGREVSFDDAVRSGVLDVVNTAGQREVTIASGRTREGLRAALPSSERRALHAEAAAQLSGASRLRHLMAATEFTDDAVADELEQAALAAISRGEYADAARRASQAAGLSGEADRRTHLLLSAAELATLADEEALAVALAPAVERLGVSPRREVALAGLRFVIGEFDEARRRLHAAGPDAGAGSGIRSIIDGGLAWAQGDPAGVLAATTAELTAPDADDVIGAAAMRAFDDRRRLLLNGGRWMGGIGDPVAGLAELLHPGDASPVTQGHAEARIMLGQAALYSGRHRESRVILERAVAESRASRSVPVLQLALSVLSLAVYITGDWFEADPLADEVLALSLETGNGTSDAMAHAVIAMMSAQRNDLATATDRIRIARGLERRRPVPQTTGIVMMAAALVERGRHDPDAVLGALDAFEGSAAGYAVDATGALGWRVLRAEALVLLGREPEAEAVLAELTDDTAPLFGHPDWVRGIARERDGDLTAAIDCYRRAAAASDLAESPWARALALSALGSALAASGEKTEAATVLRLARAAYVRIGIAATATAAPEPTVATTAAGWEVLSAREREIAELAAAGRLNREIAAELHVSVKTVEFHLGRAMGKLGVTSRRQLR
ncbi:MAG: LuxR C-terminal-related transcriptional regulator [Microbacteriaceae bacterium]